MNSSNTSKVNLRRMPDRVLARRLMNVLWNYYDSGGVSAGRSLRSDLLDAAMYLTPVDFFKQYGINRDDMDLDDVLTETRSRKRPFSHQVPRVKRFALRHMGKHCMVSLLLHALLDWYLGELRKLDAGEEKFVYSKYEHEILREIYFLLYCHDYFKQCKDYLVLYTPQELIKEVRERMRRKHDQEMRNNI